VWEVYVEIKSIVWGGPAPALPQSEISILGFLSCLLGPDSRQLRNGMEPLLQGDIADLGGM
ncbi:unnamed protein product, partial [Fusarium graminearum]